MPCDEELHLAETQAVRVLDLPAGVPPLTSLYLYIAGSCNLACRHCWITPTYQRSGNGGQFIKLEHVSKVIREAKPLGLCSVKLTGGEPTLHPQFREIVTLINESGLSIIIESNGTLIDDDLANFLKQQKVLFISVSLDGATAETHESLRMVTGSYAQAVAGIHALVKVGFHPQMICTLHRGNVSQLDAIVSLAENLGCGSIKFNHVQQIGRGEQFSTEQGLTIKDIIDINDYIDDILSPHTRIPIFLDIPFAFRPIKKLLTDPLQQCNIQQILGVLSSGEISLCGIGVTIPDLIFGNVETDNLKEIWYNNNVISFLRKEIPFELKGICGVCLHRDMCQAECIANNYHRTNQFDAPNWFCDNAESMGLFPAPRKTVFISSNPIA